VRTTRSLLDRVLSLWMPVKRYRCVAPGCAWEGLLLSRVRRHMPRARKRLPELPAEATACMAQKRPALMAFRARLP